MPAAELLIDRQESALIVKQGTGGADLRSGSIYAVHTLIVDKEPIGIRPLSLIKLHVFADRIRGELPSDA